MFQSLIDFIRQQYGTGEFIPLHEPRFWGNEKKYVSETIDSTFVSSVGKFVDQFESNIAAYTGATRAIAVVNGTAALHLALKIVGVEYGDLVITQPITFVATCNAIAYCGAEPIFIDVDLETLGLSPTRLEAWLRENATIDDKDMCRAKSDGKVIRACVPMHTFGHVGDIDAIAEVCERWHIAVVEDAAEALGSRHNGRHAGVVSRMGVLSFNGNKTLTTGGGGMILADEELGMRAKHLSTTAKQPHPYEYKHDSIGYNYRMPNINAALGCAQIETLNYVLDAKRDLAARYAEFLEGGELRFVREPRACRSNYWLNAVICPDAARRDAMLKATNSAGVMTRPIWTLMNHLPMFARCRSGDLTNAEWLEARLVNLPSSVLPSARPRWNS